MRGALRTDWTRKGKVCSSELNDLVVLLLLVAFLCGASSSLAINTTNPEPHLLFTLFLKGSLCRSGGTHTPSYQSTRAPPHTLVFLTGVSTPVRWDAFSLLPIHTPPPHYFFSQRVLRGSGGIHLRRGQRVRGGHPQRSGHRFMELSRGVFTARGRSMLRWGARGRGRGRGV